MQYKLLIAFLFLSIPGGPENTDRLDFTCIDMTNTRQIPFNNKTSPNLHKIMGQQNQENGTGAAEGYGIQKGNVNVVVRVRPLNNSERFANESNVLQFPGNGGIVATSQDKGGLISKVIFNSGLSKSF